MKNHLYPLFFFWSLILFGCSSSGFTDEQPTSPDTVEIDVDGDSEADFKIEYSFGFIFTPSGDQIIIGYFTPLGDNLVLHKSDNQNLFLRDLSEIKEMVAEPLFWNSTGWTEQILSIQNNSDGQWPRNWTASTDVEHSTYFLGVKLIDSSSTKIGWVEIRMDLTDGTVAIVDKGIL